MEEELNKRAMEMRTPDDMVRVQKSLQNTVKGTTKVIICCLVLVYMVLTYYLIGYVMQ